ncbi:MAG: sulfurtransferase TusA family protein [Nitrososphaeria archaeon]
MSHQNEGKRVVDAVGLYCPEPVFRLRKALDEAEDGEMIEFLADDPATEEDVKRLLSRRGDRIVKHEVEGAVSKFTIKKVK